MIDRVSKTIQSSLQSITMKWNIVLFAFLVIEFVQSVPLVDQILPASADMFNASLVTRTPIRLNKDSKTYRLPNNSIPLRYDLWLKTEIDKEILDFYGRVKIHIKVLEPTQIITLHMRRLDITKIDLLDVSGALVSENLDLDYDEEFEFLEITLPTQRNVNDELILDIDYTGFLRNVKLGFYRTSYRDIENDKKVFYAATNFAATYARYAMPCYDEPAIGAVIGLEIRHTKNYHAVSNMPVVSRTDVGGTNHVTTKFQDTIAMPTNLLAFVISDLGFVSNNVTTGQRIYVNPRNLGINFGDFAVRFVGPVLRKFEENFGIDYPLPKIEHAAINGFSLEALENNGLISYLPFILLHHDADPVYLKMEIIEVIIHEVAHQFFGKIVAPNWWSYSWINEGLATLFAFYIPSLIYPENQHMERMRNFVDRAYDLDVVERNALPLNFYVESPFHIRRKFEKINNKGSAMLLMFMGAITVPTFMKGLNNYLTDMYLKAATPDDLHRNLQKAYDEDFPGKNVNLGVMMSTWEDQAGYPMIHVTKINGRFHLNQSRFGGGSEVYSIPISYTTKSELDFEPKTAKLWMMTTSTTIESNDDWVILNIQSTGYYKVSYSNEIWESFIETLRNNSAVIPASCIVHVSREMLAAVKEGSVNSIYALEIIKHLINENAYKAWREASDLIYFFRTYLIATEFFDDYLALVRSVIKPHLDRLGFTLIAGESSEDILMRKLLMGLSCSALEPACLQFEEELRVIANTTGGSVESFNLCFSIANASANVYEFYLNEMLNETNKDIGEYVSCLGCTLNAELLEKFLQTSLNNTTRLDKNDRKDIIFYTMRNSRVAFKTTLRFIKTNFIKIHEM